MARIKSKAEYILQDRVLLTGLLFGSAGYIVLRSWVGMTLLVAGFMMGIIWAFRTASGHPVLALRLLATLMLVTMGAFLTVYVSVREGVIR